MVETISDLNELIHKINMDVAKQPTIELSKSFIKEKYRTVDIDSSKRFEIKDNEVMIRAVGSVYVVAKIKPIL